MSGQRQRFDEMELERLREQNPLSEFFERCGVRLRRAGREWVGLSPFNQEKTPSFTVNDEKGFYHCFSSGMHGDIFDAVQHFKGCDFVEAVKYLGGAQEITAEDRQRIERKKRQASEEEEAERQRTLASVTRQFEAALPIIGTFAAAYLERRGLPATPGWTFDLRFVEALRYRGFADAEANETTDLGEYPAMVAAIRNVSGDIIGLHRTYLDRDEPVKLTPPGDTRRNRAKKILGDTSGGMIRLSDLGPRLAIGEGIETVRGWFMLGLGGDDISIASAVSLGNLAGAATGGLPHPERPDKRIPNGVPDMDRPGVILPRNVEEVILLGDGDSDKAMTRQRLRVAGNRFRRQGREVFVQMAPDGTDFNDVWLAVEREGAAG